MLQKSKIDMLQKKTYLYFLGFFIISIIALWQIVFYIHPVKYDMIDCYFPWRYFVGECLQNGKFPYWNPYQDLGYPIHADPSSGVWYPIVWVLGFFKGYDIYTIGFEYWLHVFFAAIGFYKLCITLKLNNETAFIAGVCYMLCGIFIGNAQHLTYVISACWIPYILNYYIIFAIKKKIIDAIKTSFFVFLLITGGYPAFTIILFYLLLILFFYFAIIAFKKEENKKAGYFFLFGNGIILVLVLLLCSGILLSIYDVSPYLSRTNGFKIEKALFSPFSPQSSISFILPYASINNMAFYDTDLSMSNAYFGLITFLFFVLSLFIKKPVIYKIIFAFSVFALLASFGSYLPLRKFLFDYIPLMNLFRFPSTFRLFVIIGFLLYSAFAINAINETNFVFIKKKLKLIILFAILILLLTILLCRFNGYISIIDFITNDIFIFSKSSHLSQHIVFNSLIQIIILFSFFVLVIRVKKPKHLFISLFVLVGFDMVLSTQLNAPYTVFYKEFSAKESNNHIKKFPSGFPQLPDKAISETNPNEVYFGPYWKNVNIFQKQISAEGFNSFAFTGHEFFRDETPQLYDSVIKNKIVFLSDNIYDQKSLSKFKNDSAFTSKSVFLEPMDFASLNNISISYNIKDRVALKHFAPDSFAIETSTKNIQVLTLLQNNYKGWKAFVNGKETKILTSNNSLMSILLPAGNNNVLFAYSNIKIKFAFIVSIITVLFSLFVIVFQKRLFKI